MNRLTKYWIIAICILLCGTAAIVSSKIEDNKPEFRTKVLPIDNRAKPTKIWLWA